MFCKLSFELLSGLIEYFYKTTDLNGIVVLKEIFDCLTIKGGSFLIRTWGYVTGRIDHLNPIVLVCFDYWLKKKMVGMIKVKSILIHHDPSLSSFYLYLVVDLVVPISIDLI